MEGGRNKEETDKEDTDQEQGGHTKWGQNYNGRQLGIGLKGVWPTC